MAAESQKEKTVILKFEPQTESHKDRHPKLQEQVYDSAALHLGNSM